VTNKGKFNRIFEDSIYGIDDCEKRVQTETKKEDDYENLLNSEDSNNQLFQEQLTMKLKPI
jgi:hypothetical protein